MTSRGQVVLRGQTTSPPNKMAQITSKCNVQICPIIEHPLDPDFVLEGCNDYGEIRSYNIKTSESKTVYMGCKPWRVCNILEGSLFVLDQEGGLLQLKWKEWKRELELVHRIQTDMKSARGMCYIEQSNVLVFTCRHNIEAINPVTGSVVWVFTQDTKRQKLDPRGVCCDADGRVYVADGRNE